MRVRTADCVAADKAASPDALHPPTAPPEVFQPLLTQVVVIHDAEVIVVPDGQTVDGRRSERICRADRNWRIRHSRPHSNNRHLKERSTTYQGRPSANSRLLQRQQRPEDCSLCEVRKARAVVVTLHVCCR